MTAQMTVSSMDRDAVESLVAHLRNERAELVEYVVHLESGSCHVGGGRADPLVKGRTQAEIEILKGEISSIDSQIHELTVSFDEIPSS